MITSKVAVFLAIAAASLGAFAADPVAPKRLVADFTMTRTLAVLDDAITSTGELALGGPGLLRWEMKSPSRSVIIVNGGQAWLHYPDLKVTKGFDIGSNPVMKVMSEHLLALTAGDFDKLGELYEIGEAGGGAKKLVPRQAAVRKVFAELRVKIGDRGIISWVEMISKTGDVTRIEFGKVVLDPDLVPSLFEKPAG